MSSDESPLASTNTALTQSEVERLLSQVQAEVGVTSVIKSGGLRMTCKSEDIQPCDFRQPAFLTMPEMRKIRLRHEEFIRSLAARLSIYLRLEMVIQMSRLQTVSYQKFTEALPNPTHLTLFRVEPLKGICLLDIPPRLGLTIVDRLLGGPAHAVASAQDLSQIDIALLDQATQIVLSEWCNLWQKAHDLRPLIIGHENNGRFLRSAPHDTVMLVVAMEMQLGDCLETIEIGMPYLTIEPLVRQLGSAAEIPHFPTASEGAPVRWNPAFDDVNIELHVEWEGLTLTTPELAKLRQGDVLLLEPQCARQVVVHFERTPKFTGRLGTCGPRWAVELTGAVGA